MNRQTGHKKTLTEQNSRLRALFKGNNPELYLNSNGKVELNEANIRENTGSYTDSQSRMLLITQSNDLYKYNRDTLSYTTTREEIDKLKEEWKKKK